MDEGEGIRWGAAREPYRRLARDSAMASKMMMGTSSQNVGAEKIPVRLCEIDAKLAMSTTSVCGDVPWTTALSLTHLECG